MFSELNLSAPEINEVQRAAWNSTFRYVAEHSPFYARHFARAGIETGKLLPLAEIERIPPIDKAQISKNADDFLCVPRERVVDIVTTSGSTGEPLVWMLTEADLERLALNEKLSFECAGFTPNDTVILAVAMDRCFIAGMAYFLGLRKLGCKIVRTGSGAASMHMDMLRRASASAVVGVPSLLDQLADNAAAAGLNPKKLGIQKLVCIGEPLRNPNMTPCPIAKRLAAKWSARLFTTYGVTELASSLCECEAGLGGHLHPALLYLECLDANGNAVPDGEIGEIVATTFGVEGMPLIRYRTGDCAALFREKCRCGRSTLRMGPVVGRLNQKLKFKGTTLFPSMLKRVLDSVRGIVSYAIIARSKGPGCDEVEVRVACDRNARKILSELRERFRGEAKVSPELRTATTAEIEELQCPPGERKRRYFVDLRKSA